MSQAGSGPAGPGDQWAAPFSHWVLRTRAHDGLRELDRLTQESGSRAWRLARARAYALNPDLDVSRVAVAEFAVLAAEAPLPPDAATLFAQLLIRDHEDERARDVLASGGVEGMDAWSIRADLVNPFRSGAPLPIVEWLATFNEAFARHDLEPIVLEPLDDSGDESPFSRLRSRVPGSIDGPRTTVVVSAFRPELDLLTAVRSLADQSWADLEILVIDDASGPDYRPWLERAAALDPRVRVIEMPNNGGTYAARNHALTVATGRFITFHDFDDWAHPRRIERQVAVLEGAKHAIACRSGCVRAYPDLSLTLPGYPSTRINASSLLYRRREVTEAIGGFHDVRKSADVEFPARLRAAVKASVSDLDHEVPLAITQLRPSSLSRDDAVPGWTRWNRMAYRDVYREWHKRIGIKTTSPYLPIGAPNGRPLRGPAPPTPAFAAAAVPPTPTEYDVVFVANLHGSHVSLRRAAAELASMADAGARVGVLHAEPPVAPGPKPGITNRTIAQLLGDGVLTWADPEASLSVRTVAVHGPNVLLLRENLVPGWTIENVVLTVRTPEECDAAIPQGGGEIDSERLLAAARAALPARHYSWRALTGEAHAALAGTEALTQVPHVVRPRLLGRHRIEWPMLRVGHGILQRRNAWEMRRDRLITMFATDPTLDVRFAGGETAAKRYVGKKLPPTWLFFDDALGPFDLHFAASLDVMSTPGAVGPDVTDAVRESLAAGALVVLPDKRRAKVVAEDPELEPLIQWASGYPTSADLAGAHAARATGDAGRVARALAHRFATVATSVYGFGCEG